MTNNNNSTNNNKELTDMTNNNNNSINNNKEITEMTKTKSTGLSIENSWRECKIIRDSIMDYLAKNSGLTHSIETITDTLKLNELSVLVKTLTQKPKVAFVGRSDVGKSSMINTLLGSDKMPTSWTPTTSIAVYIKHIEDRPFYISDDVWVFKSEKKSGLNGEILLWDDTRLDDEKYCQSLKLNGGSYQILKDYGTRKGEFYAQNEASTAVVFVDSPILKNCDFIDLPGYGTGDRAEDDTLTLTATQSKNIGALIYLSISNGFMRNEDILYLQNAIKDINHTNAEPLSNLFVVASQAHCIDNGNVEALKTILVDGCERFERTLPDNSWIKEYCSHEKIRSRFFTYSLDIKGLCTDFEKDLSKYLYINSKETASITRNQIKYWAKEKGEDVKKIVQEFEMVLAEREKSKKLLSEYQKNEPQRVSKFNEDKRKIDTNIKSYKYKAIEKIEKFYDKTLDVDALEELMYKKDIRKKKEDIELFSNYVSGLLQNKTESILKKESCKLSEDVEGFLSSFDSNRKPENADNISFAEIPFNAQRAFAAGLGGVATFGALAIWASTCGNLGGYILLAKGVSLLSAIGISVGGTAAAASAIAAIGGPVVLGIGLAIMAALSIFAIFSGGWRKQVARKLIAECENQKVLENLKDSINKFWDDTQKAFDISAENLNHEWVNHLEELKSAIEVTDVAEFKRRIDEIKKANSFLDGIENAIEDN